MIKEGQIRLALRLEAARGNPPRNRWPAIREQARRPDVSGFWGRLRVAPQLLTAALAFVVLSGFIGYQIAQPFKDAPPHPLVQDATVQEIAAAVDFTPLEPSYLPPGAKSLGSVLEADKLGPDAQLNIAILHYLDASGGGFAVLEWRAETAAVAPALDPRRKGFESAAVKQEDVDGRRMSFSEGKFSGQKVYALYWHENGVNYSVISGLEPAVLRKVAASLR